MHAEKMTRKNSKHHRSAGLRILMIVVVSALSIAMLSGCTRNEPQSAVPATAITQSPENVARVFAQAVFEGDYLMMLSCYPTAYVETLTENDINELLSWGQDTKALLLQNETEYIGTSAASAELIQTDMTTDAYQQVVAGISIRYGLSSSEVLEIRSCNVRLFCKIDDEDRYQDVDILVYKSGIDWHVFDVEKADSETA